MCKSDRARKEAHSVGYIVMVNFQEFDPDHNKAIAYGKRFTVKKDPNLTFNKK